MNKKRRLKKESTAGIKSGTVRSEYEYKTEYEYDFSNSIQLNFFRLVSCKLLFACRSRTQARTRSQI